MSADLSRSYAAEALGTALLLAVVVGSGIMGEQLANGNTAVALLANTLATGAGLSVLITVLGPLSGAHFNPVVTLAEAFDRRLSWSAVPGYLLAQLTGAFAGVALAHGMFALPVFSLSRHVRSGTAQALSECVATAGLLLCIRLSAAHRSSAVPLVVGGYITAAYWFTASTSFANPAVTLARSVSDTFAGIRPADVPVFVLSQMVGAFVGVSVARWLLSKNAQPVAE